MQFVGWMNGVVAGGLLCTGFSVAEGVQEAQEEYFLSSLTAERRSFIIDAIVLGTAIFVRILFKRGFKENAA